MNKSSWRDIETALDAAPSALTRDGWSRQMWAVKIQSLFGISIHSMLFSVAHQHSFENTFNLICNFYFVSIPVQTYFDAHIGGCNSVAITSDSKFIATLSASQPQVLAIWEWTTDSEVPVCTVELERSDDLQSNLKFNSENIFQLVSNSGNQIIFYEWSFEEGLKYYDPEINEKVIDNHVSR